MVDIKINNFAISRWRAEFVDPAMERAYHLHVEADVAQFLARALKLWALLLTVFAWADWLQLGNSPGFYILSLIHI